MVNIYALISPIDNKVVYVGATTKPIKNRLYTHYRHLVEAQHGNRKMNRRLAYLDSILPQKVSITLLESNDDESKLEELESKYIKIFREINPDLLNETDGGIGNNTYKYKSKEELKEIGRKLSLANIGKKKPDGFGEHLSQQRTGAGNTMAKKFDEPIYAIKDNEIKGTFYYGFEINKYCNSNHAWSNVKKNGLNQPNHNCYKTKWMTRSFYEQYKI